MSLSENCQVCGSPDSWRHSLLKCNMARAVWAMEESDVYDLLASIKIPNAKLWMAEVLSATNQNEAAKVFTTMWAIWHAKRKLLHEDIHQSPYSTHLFIRNFLKELETIAPPVVTRGQQRVAVGRGSKAPEQGMIHIRVDGGLSRNGEVGAVAAVCRDHTGNFRGSSAVVIRGSPIRRAWK